jgi:hypothetical protein
MPLKSVKGSTVFLTAKCEIKVAEYAANTVAAVKYDVKKTRRQDQDRGVVAWPVGYSHTYRPTF